MDRKLILSTLFVLLIGAAFGFYFAQPSIGSRLAIAQGAPSGIPRQGGPSGWTDDGSIVRLTNLVDLVGIGTNNPLAKLDVVGDIVVSGTIDGFDIGVKGINWDTAFAERREWDGEASNLNAITGRTSLGLGSLATLNSVSGGLGGTIDDKTVNSSDLGVLDNAVFKDTDGPNCHKITFDSTGKLNTSPVDCITGGPISSPPLPPAAFVENFNNLADGNLGGQGGWSTPNSINWSVNSSVPIEGSKDLRVTGGSEPLGLAVNESANSSANFVTITWKFNIKNVSASGGRGMAVIFQDVFGRNIIEVSFAVSRPVIGLRHNDTFIEYRTVDPATIHSVIVEYDKVNGKYRMKVDDEAFSSFDGLASPSTFGQNIERILIESDRVNGEAFIDDIRIVE